MTDSYDTHFKISLCEVAAVPKSKWRSNYPPFEYNKLERKFLNVKWIFHFTPYPGMFIELPGIAGKVDRVWYDCSSGVFEVTLEPKKYQGFGARKVIGFIEQSLLDNDWEFVEEKHYGD